MSLRASGITYVTFGVHVQPTVNMLSTLLSILYYYHKERTEKHKHYLILHSLVDSTVHTSMSMIGPYMDERPPSWFCTSAVSEASFAFGP